MLTGTLGPRTPAIDWNGALLPAEVEQLANGLTVIARCEPRSPVVAVYVGYWAGSRDEPRSKAGLAHLCEHLMFSGTNTAPGSYFAPFEQVGAAWMNAFVKEDYSAYFATVPADALDFALRMEADRMAHLAEALNEEKVERQREVVINELLQREGEPYGCAARIVAELAHPSGHPYAHPPDGLIDEIATISLDEVRAWIVSHHIPPAASLIIAGDVEPRRAIEKAQLHFGAIAPGSVSARAACPVAGSRAATRRQIERAVTNERLYLAWNGPGFRSSDYPALEAACEILAGPANSRLASRLVNRQRLASDVAFELRAREFGSLAIISITGRREIPLDAIEANVRHEIALVYTQGPSQPELDSARLRLFGRMLRALERVGGPLSRSDALGRAAMIGGAPDVHNTHISNIANLGPGIVRDVAHRWLGADSAVLEIRVAV